MTNYGHNQESARILLTADFTDWGSKSASKKSGFTGHFLFLFLFLLIFLVSPLAEED